MFGDLAEFRSAIWRNFVRRFGGILFGELAEITPQFSAPAAGFGRWPSCR